MNNILLLSMQELYLLVGSYGPKSNDLYLIQQEFAWGNNKKNLKNEKYLQSFLIFFLEVFMTLLEGRGKTSSLPKYKTPPKSPVSHGFERNDMVSALSTLHYQGFQTKTFRGIIPTQSKNKYISFFFSPWTKYGSNTAARYTSIIVPKNHAAIPKKLF